jgi:phosphate uptake regulator
MEPRKLIQFGNSSHVISIPTDWLKKNRLNKGDVVYLSENGNNELLLSPGFVGKKEELRKVVIDVKDKPFESLHREIVSNYVAGYDVMEFVGDDVDAKSKDIRSILRNLTFLEIINHTRERIVARNFLDIKEISIDDVIRRVDTLVRTMLKDSLSSIKGDNLYDVLSEKDFDVNRLSFMLLRTIKLLFNDPRLLNNVKLTNNQLLGKWMLIMHIEKVADEARRISKFLGMTELNKKAAEDLERLYIEIEDDYINAMKSYYLDDKRLAYNIASRKGKLIDDCDEYFRRYREPIVAGIIEKMKGMITHIRDIVRVVYEYG